MYTSYLFCLLMTLSFPLVGSDDGKQGAQVPGILLAIPPEPIKLPKPKPVAPIFDCADTTASVFMGLINAFASLDTAAGRVGNGVHSFQKFANGK